MEDCGSLTNLIVNLRDELQEADQLLSSEKFEETVLETEKIDRIINQKKEFLRWCTAKRFDAIQIEDHEGLEAVLSHWPVKVTRTGSRVVWIDGEYLHCRNLENWESGWSQKLVNPSAAFSTEPEFITPVDFWIGSGAIYVRGIAVDGPDSMKVKLFVVTASKIGDFVGSPQVMDDIYGKVIGSYEPGVLCEMQTGINIVSKGDAFDTSGYKGGSFREIKISKDNRTVLTLSEHGSLDLWSATQRKFINHLADNVKDFQYIRDDLQYIVYLAGGKLHFYLAGSDVEWAKPAREGYEKIAISNFKETDAHIFALKGKQVDVYMNHTLESSFSLQRFVGEAEIKTFDLSEGGKLVLGLSDGRILVLEWDKIEE